jgi:hypothetical protein
MSAPMLQWWATKSIDVKVTLMAINYILLSMVTPTEITVFGSILPQNPLATPSGTTMKIHVKTARCRAKES